MVRVVRTPDIGRQLFTHSQLSGWSETVEYSITQPKRRKRKRRKASLVTRTRKQRKSLNLGRNLLD